MSAPSHDPKCLLKDKNHPGPHHVAFLSLDDPGVYRCSWEDCDYQMWDAAPGDVEDHYGSHATPAPLESDCDCDCHLCDCYLRHAEGTDR